MVDKHTALKRLRAKCCPRHNLPLVFAGTRLVEVDECQECGHKRPGQTQKIWGCPRPYCDILASQGDNDAFATVFPQWRHLVDYNTKDDKSSKTEAKQKNSQVSPLIGGSINE